MKTYHFKQQYDKVIPYEQQLDAYFSNDYNIVLASDSQQHEGIDRIYYNKASNRKCTVEYKNDFYTAYTGNFFIETCSVDTAKKLGWAYTSTADTLFYYSTEDSILYIVPFYYIRFNIDRWKSQYETRRVNNVSYFSWGVLVPVEEFYGIAKARYINT